MPYVNVNASMPLSDSTMDKLQKEIGAIIARIPGKNIDNCMTQLNGGCPMFMEGKAKKVVFCEVQMFGAAAFEEKKAVFEGLDGLFRSELGAEQVYLNFCEFTEWGSRGEYKAK